jgi:hypothetical protein
MEIGSIIIVVTVKHFEAVDWLERALLEKLEQE